MPFSLWKKNKGAKNPSVEKRVHSSSDGEVPSPCSSRNSSNMSTTWNRSSCGSEGYDTRPSIGSPEWLHLSKIYFEASWTGETNCNSTPQTRLTEFTQIKKLASGCFGPIILLRKKESGNYYALKVLDKHIVYSRHQIQKAETEKRILQSLHFPFLVNLKYHGQDSFNLYLFMDYFPGGDLWHLMQRQKGTGRNFIEAEVRFYMSQVVLALEYLHYMDLVYRDLKPENIFIDSTGYIKIGDFGYSKRVKKDGRAVTQCGTRDYMAPEIVIGQSYTRGVDYWSLGVLIYEFVTGVTPFYSQSKIETYEKIVNGKYRTPSNVSKEVKDLIQKLLVVDAGKRLGNWKNGMMDLKNHDWFTSAKLNWQDILEKKLKAPFVPQLKNPGDTKYFVLNTLSDLNNNQGNSQNLFKQQETTNFIDYYDKYFENF